MIDLINLSKKVVIKYTDHAVGIRPYGREYDIVRGRKELGKTGRGRFVFLLIHIYIYEHF